MSNIKPAFLIKYVIWIIVLSVNIILLTFTSCIEEERLECTNAQITFRNYISPTEEKFELISSNIHLLFKDDLLVGKLSINSKQEGEGLFSDIGKQSLRQLNLKLPVGKYTLITWSNYVEDMSVFSPLNIGTTRINEVMLRHNNPTKELFNNKVGALIQNSERLYYGYCEFEVNETNSINKIVDLLTAHTQFTFVVQWENNAPDQNPIEVQLTGMRTIYYQYPTHSLEMTAVGNPVAGEDTVMEFVPQSNNTTAIIGTNAIRQTASQITATLITYRLSDGDDFLLNIWGGAGGQTQLVKNINLKHFFEIQDWKLSYNFRQYFGLYITVDANKIEVTPIDKTGWIDGGNIGSITK